MALSCAAPLPSGDEGEKSAVVPERLLWPAGDITLWMDGRASWSAEFVAEFEAAIAELEADTPVRFRLIRSAAEASGEYRRISEVPGQGIGASPLGTEGGHTRVSTGAIRHELGHVVGLQHTHQRVDANQYIQVHWGLLRERSRQARQIDFAPKPLAAHIGPYDLDSIMHYPSRGPQQLDQCALVSKLPSTGPSREDVCVTSNDGGRWITANRQYYSYWDLSSISALYCDARYCGENCAPADRCQLPAVQAHLARLHAWESSAEGQHWAERHPLSTRNPNRGTVSEAKARCYNGVQDPNETGVDCGGVCWFDCHLCDVQTSISVSECDGIWAVYNATGGHGWSDGLIGLDTEVCDGLRVICGARQDRNVVTELNLRERGLTGSFPEEIDLLAHLEILSLQHNDLTGPLPAGIGRLGQLRVLKAQYNRLSGAIPNTFSGLSSLAELDLRYNQLSGSIPDALYEARQLEVVSLGGNPIEGALSESIAQWSRLRSLSISQTQISGEIPRALMQLPGLQSAPSSTASLNLASHGCLTTADAELESWLNAHHAQHRVGCSRRQ